jgi:hypothetical protein
MQVRRPLTSSLIRRTTTTPAIDATSTTVIYDLDLRTWNCLVVNGELGYHDVAGSKSKLWSEYRCIIALFFRNMAPEGSWAP